MMNDRNTKHPTFGVIGLSRCTGRVRLFGSHMETNSSFIKLTIKRAEHKFHLGQTWIHGSTHLCEVYLSPAQFAQMLTDMNFNDGVPCTIRHVKGEPDPGEVPEMPSEHKHIRDDVIEGLGGLSGKLKAAKATALEAIGSRLPKATLATVTAAFDAAINDIGSGVPFATEQFQRAADRVETALKAEMDAVLTSVVTRLGRAALADPGTVQRLLDGPKEPTP